MVVVSSSIGGGTGLGAGLGSGLEAGFAGLEEEVLKFLPFRNQIKAPAIAITRRKEISAVICEYGDYFTQVSKNENHCLFGL